MPGQWARLSNISEDGKWLRTETFRLGSKEVVRTKGASAGRALEAYRKVRKSHPELVAQLDIMSQPASNVDSVILSWVIEGQASEHPCSMWQRDCFSSVFADSAVQSMAAAQQVSCLVAAKCTSKLQITDSDFAKQFKALVRKKLLALRHDFQHAQKNTSSVFKVGALEIVTSVPWAQQEMTAKNWQHQWVLRAAVRNGLLAWRPNPETGRLEEVCSQPWAKELGLSMGSRRIPPQWFQDRLKSLEPSGCPRKADWSLSDSAKTISDLQRWDYYNPEKDAQNDLEEGPELEGDLAEEIAANAENCLSLSLHPRLRRAALRQAAEEGFAEQRKTRQGNLKIRKVRQLLRDSMWSKLVKALREKVALSNRAEALRSIVPQAQGKKGSAKTSKPSATSIKDKPSAKSKLSKHLKPSAKTKPSLSKKAQKKQAQKAAADKQLKPKKGLAKPSDTTEEPPPLPPPSGPPPEFLTKEVLVSSEASGATLFGRQGTDSHYAEGKYHVVTSSGTFQVAQEHLSLVSSKPAVKPLEWPKWTSLSRKDCQRFLQTLFCYPEYTMPENNGDLSTTSVDFLPVTAKTNLSEDQQLWLGWQALRWAMQKKGLGLPEDELSVNTGPCWSATRSLLSRPQASRPSRRLRFSWILS